MPVSHKRKELRDLLEQYSLIVDCVRGETAIKARRDKYLPFPSLQLDDAARLRYTNYITRAHFYNVAKRTLVGLVGQIFMRDPVIEIPDLMDPIKEDATGSGVALDQLAKEACTYVLALGRAGLFTDYPKTDAPATRADLEEGKIRPIITLYGPQQVINWRTIKKGAHEFLSLVVIEEEYLEETDEFMDNVKKQWRVLRLDDAGNYFQQIWRDDQSLPFETINPRDANDQPLKEIPFSFVGAYNNNSKPDDPPLYDLAALNVAHYRNSADYEESCFIAGQPTPFFTGLTEDWLRDQLKGTIALGSRAAIPLPVGGNAGLLQAAPNSMPFEAMQHKERQMVALGAKLVEVRTVQRTAKEAEQEESSELSTLSNVAKNVGAAFQKTLQWSASFAGVPAENIKYNLSSEFDLTKLSPEERRQTLEEWQAGAISWGELRENLRRGGIATMDDEEARKEIDRELATMPRPVNVNGVGDPSNGGANGGQNQAGQADNR